MKKEGNYRLKLILLCVLQALIVISPVIAVVIYKRNDYFHTPEKAFSLGVGGIIALTIIVLQSLGKTPKNVHKLIKLGVLTLFLWVLKPILSDLCLLMSASFLGELLGFLIFSRAIRMQRLRVSALETKKIETSLDFNEDKEIDWRGRA